MNLLPITITKGLNDPVSANGNASAGSLNTGQTSEFTGILSESLGQQNSHLAHLETPLQTPGQAPITALSGQELPLTGESLPLNPALVAQGVVAEDDLRLLGSTAGVVLETLTNPVPEALAEEIVPETALAAESLVGVSVEQSGTPVSIATASILNENGASKQEAPAVAQNTPARQATPAMLLSSQTATPQQLQNNPGQTSTGDNGLASQPQTMPIAEFSAASVEDKVDFSRIIEKALPQLNKESISSPLPPIAETSTKSTLEHLKTATDSMQLQQSIDKPKWTQEFGSRMLWLTKEGVQSAQLKLTPAHLGAIEVKISIQNDQASVSFVSQHGAVRDAIESSLPRLREMMQEAGVKLEQANVSTNSNSNAQQHASHSDKTPGQQTQANGLMTDEDETLSASTAISTEHEGSLSGIDFYA